MTKLTASGDIDLLRRRVTEFREALIAYRTAKAEPSIPFFPHGACTLAGWLLTRWFESLGYSDIQYLQGTSPLIPDGIRHGWLVVSGVIVDITADQFGQDPVIVAAESPFHASFAHPECFDAINDTHKMRADAIENQEAMVRGILKHMPQNTGTPSHAV